MSNNRGGRRPGAGRPKGSKNKMTIVREAVAEVLDVPDPQKMASAIHERGHQLLLEMERIAKDPSEPIAARIMAARTALPFLLPKQSENPVEAFQRESLDPPSTQERARIIAAALAKAANHQDPYQSAQKLSDRGP